MRNKQWVNEKKRDREGEEESLNRATYKLVS